MKKRITALLLSILMLFSLLPMTASAATDSGTFGDGLKWSLDSGGTLTISGTGAMKDCSYPSSAPWRQYDSDIKSVAIDNGVTSIGGYAFCGCSSLTSVTIPNSVTSIGDSAFSSCSSLTSVTIPDSVTSIGNCAFSGCSSLETIKFGSGLTKIGNRAFGIASDTITGSSCKNLKKIYISDLKAWCEMKCGYDSSPLSCNYNTKELYLNDELVTKLEIPEGTTRIASYAFYNCGNITNITIPDSVTTIEGSAFSGTALYNKSSNWENGVLYIGKHLIKADYDITSCSIKGGTLCIADGAFYCCYNLISVSIPDSVTNIGDETFYYCSSLKSVSIPNSVTSIENGTFQNCYKLTSVSIPNSLTSIENYAFYNCSSITNIYISDIKAWCENEINYEQYANPFTINSNTKNLYVNDKLVTELEIPEGTTKIAPYAFCYCGKITSVTIPNSVTSIGSSAFYGTALNWEDEVLYVGKYLIDAQTGITSCSIKEGTLCIADSAFAYCSSLTSVTIPDSVKSIGDYAFYNCSSLKSVTIPNSVTSIGSYAFYNCSSLTSVTIPNSVTSIGSYAFEYCSNLTSVTIPDSVTSIGRSAFYNCSRLTSVTIPDSVESIGSNAFAECRRLTSVTIGDSVESIGSYAFSGCSRLTSVTIGNSVTSIGDNAFYKCSSLTSVTIPDSVESIGSHAFYECGSLKSVTIGDSVTSIGSSAFYGCSSLTGINVSANNNSFCSVDGVLYNKDKTELICYPAGKTAASFSIPSFVTSIGECAFYNCSSLTSVTIGNSVTSIGNSAFHYCSSLTSAKFTGNAPTTFGSYVFSNCASGFKILVPENDSTWTSGSAYNYNASAKTWKGYNIEFYHVHSYTPSDTPPSCTEQGYTTYICACGDSYVDPDSYIDSTDHAYGNAVFTWSSDGTTASAKRVCANDESHVLSGDAVVTKVSSCEAAGITVYSAAVTLGGAAYTETKQFEDSAAKGHNFVNGVCSYCQCKGGIEGNITWALDSEGVLTISGSGYMTDYSSESGNEAPWSGLRDDISAVTVGEGLLNIGSYAFEYCMKLETVSLPETLETIGGYAFFHCESLAEIELPDGIESLGDGVFCACRVLKEISLPGKLTKVSRSLLEGCSALERATLGNKIETIEEFAFTSCSKLKAINIPKTVKTIKCGIGGSNLKDIYIEDIAAWLNIKYSSDYNSLLCGGSSTKNLYLNNELIKDLIIPEGVETIPSYAFYYCVSIESVVIPASVKTINKHAFGTRSYSDNLSKLKKVYISDLKAWCSINFEENTANPCYYGGADLYLNGTLLTELVIPDGIKFVENGAFSGCMSIDKLTVPDGVVKIGKWAFEYCRNLADVSIGNDVYCIDKEAFQSCSIKELSLPDSLESIGDSAFRYCKALELVSFGKGLKTIGLLGFYDCDKLAVLNISDLKAWCEQDDNSYYPSAPTLYLNGEEVTALDIPDGTTKIGARAFNSFNNITSVTIPGTVNSIADAAFFNCTGLKTVTIENGVGTLGKSVFSNCSSLETVYIPASVSAIGGGSFEYCSALQSSFYAGTSEQWSSVDLGSNNSYLTNTLICHVHTYAPVITTPTTCTTDGVRSYACDCGDIQKTEVIPAGHTYGSTTYDWDGSSCTATKVCTVCAEGTEGRSISETKTGTYFKDTDATCTTPETGHYEVTFNDSRFGSASSETGKTIIGSAKGHTYGSTTYDWKGSSCTATKVCTVCAEGTEGRSVSETKTGTYSRDTNATCTTAETGHYEVTFNDSRFGNTSSETGKTINGTAKGHTYEPIFTWSAYNCSAQMYCDQCKATRPVSSCIVTSDVTKEPTTTSEGVRTYTATAEYNGQSYVCNQHPTESIPKLDNGGGNDGGSFFSKIIETIMNILRSIFPFC